MLRAKFRAASRIGENPTSGSVYEAKPSLWRCTALRRGFTLIELLVVIAVIAVLVAMLLPVLSRTKAQAHNVVCVNNLRQIWFAFASYASDWNDVIPPTGSSWCSMADQNGVNGRGTAWYHYLGKYGYLGSTLSFIDPYNDVANSRWAVLRCPSEKGSFQVYKNTYYDNGWMCSSYAINWSVYGYCYGPWGAGGDCSLPYCSPWRWRKAFMKGPEDGLRAQAPLVMDCYDWGSGWQLPFFGWGVDVDSVYGATVSYAFRHSGERANVLYMDGHVEAVDPHWKSGRNVYKSLWSSEP